MKKVKNTGNIYLLPLLLLNFASISFATTNFTYGRVTAIKQALATPDLNISDPCNAGFTYMLDNLDKEWPWKMLDAWGRAEAGQYMGNVVWEGDYDACMYSTREEHTRTVNAKAFTFYWSDPKVEYRGFLSCLPDSCTEDDGKILLSQGTLLEGYSIPVNESSARGIEKLDISKDPYAIVTIVVIAVFVVIVLVASFYDYFIHCKQKEKGQHTNGTPTIVNKDSENPADGNTGTYKKTQEDEPVYENETEKNNKEAATESIPLDDVETALNSNEKKNSLNQEHATVTVETTPQPAATEIETETPKPGKCLQILLAFSLYTNVPRLLSTHQPKDSFKALHGMRFLAMCWIILGHTWQLGVVVTATPTLENRFAYGFKFGSRYTFGVIHRMYLAVECFFILSGLLTTYSFLKQLKKLNGKPTVKTFALFFFHRYWRLTPVYALILMFYTALFPYLGTGPFYPDKFPDVDNCDTKWWTHLLYLNNMIDVYRDCMGWTWYLANDFQFYVMSPFIIVPLYLKPKLGYALIGIGIIGSQITNIGLTYLHLYHGMAFFPEIYIRPYTRCGPYILGMLAGALLYHRDRKLKMSIGWKIGCLFLCLCVVNLVVSIDIGIPIFWSPFVRIAYAGAVFLIVLMCTTGNGLFVNTVFSWSGWVPVSKLTYIGYLIHPIILYYGYYSRVKQLYLGDWLMINYFLGTLVMTLGISFCVSLICEIPMLAIEKVLLPRDTKKTN